MKMKTLLVASMIAMVAASHAVIIYDTIAPQAPANGGTGAPTFTGSTPRNWVADDFSTIAAPSGFEWRVRKIDFQPVFAVVRTYTNVQARIRVFNTWAASTTNVFSNQISDVTWNFGNFTNTGTGAVFTTASLDYFLAGQSFNFTGNLNKGISIQMLENGVATNDITVGITNITGPTTQPASVIGTATNGWYRDADNNSVFTDADRRIFTGTWSSEALKIDATAVPEPGTMAAIGLGVAALIRRRRSKKA
jgi:hypothetical protein